MKQQQQGGTILGFILGLVVGLGAALGVAVYVSKVPVPFINKGGPRGVDQDAAEVEKNKNWDPNSPLYGKNPAPINAPAADTAPVAASAQDGQETKDKDAKAAKEAKDKDAKAAKDAANDSKNAARPSSADPLGDLAKAKSGADSAASDGKDPFSYFVQAGAFRTQADADAQRAKLAILGWEARVSEREQSGRTVFRVRIGPFDKRTDADQIRGKLDNAKVESNLVRVQR
jgi:cell division protein FtsN